jgi:SagB-type dehydrogenase family enzyme
LDYSHSRRTYPSAGARYPIDTYVILLQSSEFPTGAYFFDPRDFSLLSLVRGSLVPDLVSIYGEPWVKEASAVVFFVAQWQRTREKYGDRSVPYAYLEAGHMAQNMLMTAGELGLSTCPVGGFWQSKVERILGLVVPEETPIYSLVIGGKGV